jgi:uncharacterized membrane protein YedE/YeeE
VIEKSQRNERRGAAAFVAGLLFALGLAVGGMTLPSKVIGFLDVTGDWDPSLMFVMAGAIAVHTIVYRLVLRRGTPLFAERFALPTRRDLDARLITGAAIFGVGWGLGGYCPGPGLASLASGAPAALVFAFSMLGAMWLTGRIEKAREAVVHAKPQAARR